MVKPADPEDPMALVGVGLDKDPDEQALAEMARAFVEEYARLGWSGDQILRMFRSPAYRGPHHILHVKGEEFVRALVGAVDDMRSQLRPQDRNTP
jgi:hypothetical protein